MKKLYTFKKWFWCFKSTDIFEVDIIKETERQYIVDNKGWKMRVNKSDMKNGDYDFYETFELAKNGYINYLKDRIDIEKRTIISSQKSLDEYKKFLKERFDIDYE